MLNRYYSRAAARRAYELGQLGQSDGAATRFFMTVMLMAGAAGVGYALGLDRGYQRR